MVRLEHVNKFFNRRKKNEIHVINDTTLQMESKGLVALLGPSGCGKTTLLNVIGGLDKVGSGNVYINGQKLTGRRAGKVDQIRNLNVGYIFQNYNLVDSMTVFDNVAIALKMVGVKDKKEIEEKVNYVLEKVGMYRYRNRYADMLSGGERQRVGIARAIVKNPAIVIADEPTGNLDSKNTLEVMNIIKAISEDKLVILVTHEEQLAEFYASRIIRILDGKVISDEINDHADNLDYRIENKIYLKDIPDHKRLKTDLYNLDFYNENGGTLDLDIVIRNGNIYIRTNNENDRLEIVDENSSIELVDDHYRKLSREDSMENSFDPQRLAVSGVRKYHSILNPWTMIKRGFKTVFNYNILKKILLLGFLISAIFITYSISRKNGKSSIVMIVLAGMVISAVFEALVSLMKYVADPEEELPTITYWLMGSMSRSTYNNLMMGAPFIIAGILLIFALRWRLNIMSLNEDEASSLGMNIQIMRLVFIAASSMITASCVSMCGQVGWVGLLIPHISRMIGGNNNRSVIPISIGLGAFFMIVMDTFARAATAAEIPISILTAIVGAPVFIILLRKTGGAWS